MKTLKSQVIGYRKHLARYAGIAYYAVCLLQYDFCMDCSNQLYPRELVFFYAPMEHDMVDFWGRETEEQPVLCHGCMKKWNATH